MAYLLPFRLQPDGAKDSRHRAGSVAAWICLTVVMPLLGCSEGGLQYTDTDVVVTVRDPGRSYHQYGTFAVPDEVIDLCEGGAGGAGGEGGAAGAQGTGDEGNCLPVTHKYDEEILAAIRRNMAALGFEQVEADADPDVMVLPGIVAQNSWFPYYPYCDYWYDYCFGYGWGPVAVSYRIGTLLMYMVATNEVDEERGIAPVIWVGAVTGLVSGSVSLDKRRIDVNIDQAFQQSRYLGEGK